MTRVFIGSEALAAGRVNRYQLANTYQRLFPDVYAPRGELTLLDRNHRGLAVVGAACSCDRQRGGSSAWCALD